LVTSRAAPLLARCGEPLESSMQGRRKDRLSDPAPSHAIIYIPGFMPVGAQTSTNQIDDLFQLLQVDRVATRAIIIDGVQGNRLTYAGTTCDVFMATWQDRLDRLSGKPLIYRVFRSVSLIVIGIPVWLRQFFSSSPAFAAQTTVGMMSLISFAYLAVATTLTGFHLAKGSVIGTIFDANKWWFISLALFVASTGIATGDIADIVDAYNRYVTDPNSVLRDRIRRYLCCVIDKITAAGYSEIAVVAHSFGALLAIDSIPHRAKESTRINLATLGASFGYILDLQSSQVEILIDHCRGSVGRWIDITSANDPVASGVSAVRSDLNAIEQRVDLSSTFWDYLSASIHSAYFANSDVRLKVKKCIMGI